MGSPHLVPSSCFWRSVLTDLVHPALVCRPLLPPQGVLAILLPEHWATEKKRFVRSRNNLREKKGNAECWLLGKGGASAAVVENAWEAPLTIALCYGLACVHTTKDQRSLKGSGYLHAVQHLAWVSSELPAEPHRPQVNNYCTGDVFLSLKFSKWWKDWVADCQHDVFQQGVKAFWVLQHSMEDSGHEVSWDGWRTVQGTVWSSSCQALLSVQPEKKPWQSCRGFSLGETSWFAPEQRQEGAHMHAMETAGEQSPRGTQAAELAVQTKGALIPPPWSPPGRC